MQTFLPYADFQASSTALDDRRLGKQRVETFQILRALTWPEYAWKNHPAVRMWRGFIPALVAYGLGNCVEWTRRGNADTVAESLLVFTDGQRPDEAELRRRGQLPPWLGLPALHLSHQSALMRKDPEFYRPLFGEVPDDLPYLWPPDPFPRWPARRRVDAEPGLAAALEALGYDQPRPGQAEAVAAVEGGRDVLACFAPRAGATSAGLLAGLTGAGPTLWLSTHAGGGGELPPGGVPGPEPRVREQVESEQDEAGPDNAAEQDGGTEVNSAETNSAETNSAETKAPAAPPAGGGIARPPSPVEVMAVRTEAEAVPDFHFHRPADLLDERVRADIAAPDNARIVLDLAAADEDTPSAVEAQAIRALRVALELSRGRRTPLMVVGPAAAPERRAALTDALSLVDPAAAGGGFDPAHLLLGVLRVPDESRRRRAVADLLARGPRPGLVVAADLPAARRTTKGLDDRGARVALLAPAGRPSLAQAAVAAWRRGSTALVLPGGPVPAERLGRKDARFVHLTYVPHGRAGLLDLLRSVPNRNGEPTPSILVLTDAEIADVASRDPGLSAVLAGGRCRRQALLDEVGEPVVVPCDRCDVCLGIPAPGLLDTVTESVGRRTDAVSTAR